MLLRVRHRVGFQTTPFGKVLPDVRTMWQHVRTLPSVPEYSEIFWVSFTDAESSDSIDSPDARSSRSDAVLFWEEYRYSGKAVAEDRLDAAK